MKREFGELPDAVARGPMESVIGLKWDIGTSEAKPVDESPREALCLAETVEFINYHSVEESEVGRIGHDIGIGDFIERPVKESSTDDFYPRVAFAGFTDADDDFESVFPLLNELRNDPNRMLQIRIDHHAGISGAEIYAGGRGDFFAEVSGEVDIFSMTIGGNDPFYFVIGTVEASIIDEDKFIGVPTFKGDKHIPKSLVERPDIFFLVVGWNDEREGFHGISVSRFFFFLKGSGVDEQCDQTDGKNDKKDADGANGEIFEEPWFVLGNALIEFMEVLPPMVISIDRPKGKGSSVEGFCGGGIQKRCCGISRWGREKTKVFRFGIVCLEGKEETIGFTFRIGDTREGEAVHVVGIEKRSLKRSFEKCFLAGRIGEFRYEEIAIFDAWRSQENLDDLEIIPLGNELFREGLSGIYFLDLTTVKRQWIGKGDNHEESQEYEDDG